MQRMGRPDFHVTQTAVSHARHMKARIKAPTTAKRIATPYKLQFHLHIYSLRFDIIKDLHAVYSHLCIQIHVRIYLKHICAMIHRDTRSLKT
jgi:hypothetical protein